ncbi:hypothetical protein [Rhizobium sp. BR 314]|uniref:hypothetical protein n=1 Tax=Rhizobium sp. BR 314 TaxID=3040013 RepID=UPI0039BF9CC8
MQRLERLAKGSLPPKNLETLKRVFDQMVRGACLDFDECRRDRLAKRLIFLFQSGLINPAQLEKIAMLWELTDDQLAKPTTVYKTKQPV